MRADTLTPGPVERALSRKTKTPINGVDRGLGKR